MTHEQMVALLMRVPVNRVYEALTIAPKLEPQTDRDRAGWRASREPNMFVFQHYTATEARNGGILCVLAPQARRDEFKVDLNRVVGSTPGGGYLATLLMAEQFSVDD